MLTLVLQLCRPAISYFIVYLHFTPLKRRIWTYWPVWRKIDEITKILKLKLKLKKKNLLVRHSLKFVVTEPLTWWHVFWIWGFKCNIISWNTFKYKGHKHFYLNPISEKDLVKMLMYSYMNPLISLEFCVTNNLINYLSEFGTDNYIFMHYKDV